MSGQTAPGRPSSAEIVMIALDVVEAMAHAAGMSPPVGVNPRDMAVEAARSTLAGLNADTARRVAIAIADQALFSMPAKRDRASLVAWVERVRLEATWAAS